MAALPEETTEALQSLNDAIITANPKNFEKALATLIEQNQLAAISTYLDMNGRTPLINAITANGENFLLTNYSIEYGILLSLPVEQKQDKKLGHKNAPFKYLPIFKATENKYYRSEELTKPHHQMSGEEKLQAGMTPWPKDKINIPYTTYFAWRLLSFSEINPNVPDDENVGDNQAYTPLHHAIWNGRKVCFDLLTNHPRINIHKTAIAKQTPLHVAAFKGKHKFAAALIFMGSNVNARTAPDHHILDGMNLTALEIAIARGKRKTTLALFSLGAGIGATLNTNQLQTVLGGVELENMALFFAQDLLHKPITDDNMLFLNCAITPFWEEKLKTDENFRIQIYNPAYPFLKHIEQLQRRCFELITLYPDRPEFQQLAMYLGAYIPHAEIVITHAPNGEELENPITKAIPGTLQSLTALKLAAATKKEKEEAIKSFIASRNATENELLSALTILKNTTREFQIQKRSDVLNLRKMLSNFNEQVQHLLDDRTISITNETSPWDSQDFRDCVTIGAEILLFDGIIGGGAFLLFFLINTIALAILLYPILPAMAAGAFIAFLSFGIVASIAALVGVGFILFAIINEAVKYAGSSVLVYKSLAELADIIKLIPELMGNNTRLLFADILENGLSKSRLLKFLKGFQEEIEERLSQTNLGLQNPGEISKIDPKMTQWKFYPVKRRENLDIDEKVREMQQTDDPLTI